LTPLLLVNLAQLGIKQMQPLNHDNYSLRGASGHFGSYPTTGKEQWRVVFCWIKGIFFNLEPVKAYAGGPYAATLGSYLLIFLAHFHTIKLAKMFLQNNQVNYTKFQTVHRSL